MHKSLHNSCYAVVWFFASVSILVMSVVISGPEQEVNCITQA
jgi:hypothetical protein